MKESIASWLFAALWFLGTVNDSFNENSPRHGNAFAIKLQLLSAAEFLCLGFVLLLQDQTRVALILILAITFATTWWLWMKAKLLGPNNFKIFELSQKVNSLQTYGIGILLGLIISFNLATLYVGKESLANLLASDLQSVPVALLLLPLVPCIALATVAGKFNGRDEIAPISFGLGNLLGAVMSVLIYLLFPIRDYSILSHILVGVMLGGGIGFIFPLISKWLYR